MMRRLLLVCVIGYAESIVTSFDACFDKQTVRAARVQLLLAKKKSELKNGLSTSPDALKIEIELIERRLSILKDAIPVLKLIFYPPFDCNDIQSALNSIERSRKVDNCVLSLIEKERQLLNDLKGK